ncbi:hypothetical protein BGZ96_009717 [Linnemannia gamsii]|uniref:Uncharacterized protein n=1 Tax=Linnemannia gamsii TaxID=64522 RepID=A0ABQ7KDM7_9FUNG|nr:hypothetical protein BGZ96_009717 [Linnemannia gamsii]
MSNQHLKEGNLVLDCIASDPTSSTASLYGIATATPNDPSNGYTVLVKSNPNPSDVKALQWTIVSMIRLSETSYRHPVPGTVACAVSSEEEFTAFFYDTNTRSMSGINSVAGPMVVPVGVRYNPKSGWKDIRGSSRFVGLDKDMDFGLWMKYRQLAFYVPRVGGGEEVVWLMTDEYTSVVRFGVVDEATNTLQLAGVWKMKRDGTYEKGTLSHSFERTMFTLQPGVFPKMTYTDSRQVAYGDGHLYFTGRRLDDPTNVLTTYPFASRDAALKDPAPGVVGVPEPEKYTYLNTFFGSQGGNRTYLGGVGYRDLREQFGNDTGGLATQMIQDPSNTYSSKKLFQPVPMVANFTEIEHYPISRFESIGQSTPFAVISMTDGLYGIPLTASATGEKRNLTGPLGVLIMANESMNTWPRVYDKQQVKKKISLESWMIAGAVVIVVGVGLYLRRRNRQTKEPRETIDEIELKNDREDV